MGFASGQFLSFIVLIDLYFLLFVGKLFISSGFNYIYLMRGRILLGGYILCRGTAGSVFLTRLKSSYQRQGRVDHTFVSFELLVSWANWFGDGVVSRWVVDPPRA